MNNPSTRIKRIGLICVLVIVAAFGFWVKTRGNPPPAKSTAPSSMFVRESYKDLISSFQGSEAVAQQKLAGKVLEMPAHLISVMPDSVVVDFGGRIDAIELRNDARSILPLLQQGKTVVVSCKSASYAFLYLKIDDCTVRAETA